MSLTGPNEMVRLEKARLADPSGVTAPGRERPDPEDFGGLVMSRTPKKRRVALVVLSCGLVSASLLGIILGRAARASSQLPPQSLASAVPYPQNCSKFMVSIQNSLYDMNSKVLYATVTDPSGTLLGYLSVDNSGANQAFSQVTVGTTVCKTITVVFDTNVLPPSTPAEKRSVPAKDRPEKPILIPTGSTLCITTNLGDSCPRESVDHNQYQQRESLLILKSFLPPPPG